MAKQIKKVEGPRTSAMTKPQQNISSGMAGHSQRENLQDAIAKKYKGGPGGPINKQTGFWFEHGK